MNGIRNTYLYVCGSQRLLNIRRIYTSAGLIGLRLMVGLKHVTAAVCKALVGVTIVLLIYNFVLLKYVHHHFLNKVFKI